MSLSVLKQRFENTKHNNNKALLFITRFYILSGLINISTFRLWVKTENLKWQLNDVDNDNNMYKRWGKDKYTSL